VGATDDPGIGSTLAGYRLDVLIARGGMGVVYRATHLALERPVALKVIARQYAGDEGFRKRFLRESRLAAQLDHPAVVPVFDAREEEGELIVAMRLIEGGDLKKRIASRGPLPSAEAVALLGQVASALDAAHAAGIVHRDVKPHNIMLEGDRAYLTDFGLAKALGDSGVLSEASVVGTVEYMSPEQWRGEQVGPAADVYSLGCVLYEALTGVAPYGRKESDTEPELPRGMEAVIERAVAKDPAERFATAGELIGAARECHGATPATTQVLSERADAPTVALGAGAPPEREPGAVGWVRHVWRRYYAAHAWYFAWMLVVGVLAVAYVVFVYDRGGPSVSAPIDVGRPPIRLAVGAGLVWTTSAPEGTLSQIGTDTRETVGRPLRLVRGVSGVTVGGGSVWVADPRHGEVLGVDPATEAVKARIGVGGRPGGVRRRARRHPRRARRQVPRRQRTGRTQAPPGRGSPPEHHQRQGVTPMGKEFEIRREVELPATPEAVWEAVATGPGTASWLFPEDPGPDAKIEADRPNRFAVRTEGPDGFNAVEFVIDLLARGWNTQQILAQYDHLTADDIQACLAYASEVLKSEKVYLVPG